MKNVTIAQQDDALFQIDNPKTDAEAIAKAIIADYNSAIDNAKDIAWAESGARVIISKRVVENEDVYKTLLAEKTKGYSYTNEAGVETWTTPNAVLVARFVRSLGGYLNEFEFEITEK